MAREETDPTRLKDLIAELTREIQKKEEMLAAKLAELRGKEELAEAEKKRRVTSKTTHTVKD